MDNFHTGNGKKSSNKTLIIAIILIITLIIIAFFTFLKPNNALENAAIDETSQQILNSLGEDERVDDFLTIYETLHNLDLTNEKKSNKQIEQVNKISEKHHIKPIKIKPHDKNTDSFIIDFYYDLLLPVYYEKAPFSKNSVDVRIEELVDTFASEGYIYPKEWGEELYRTNTKYYKSSELKGPYSSFNYHNKDKYVDYITFIILDNQWNWSESEFVKHVNQSFEQQMNNFINLVLQDISIYSNVKKTPMLNTVFSEEEINILNWFLYQLDEEQLKRYDVCNNEDTKDCTALWIQANLNDKTVLIVFGMDGIKISLSPKEKPNSDFEKNLRLLDLTFLAFMNRPENITSDNMLDLSELYNSRQKSDLNSDVISGADFLGSWGDTYSQRASMDIEYNDGIYSIEINWSSSSTENAVWRMTGEFIRGEETGIISYDCTQVVEISSENTSGVEGITEEILYENGKAFFYIENDMLYWTDYSENAGENSVFEKIE